MTMIEPLFGLVIGVVVGFAYFCGLRWTVERVVGVEQPIRTLVLSFVVRATVLVVVAALVIQWSLVALAAGAVGFAGVRFVMLRRVRRSLTWN
jgi:F1F0 ATPase subunit 2